MSEGLALDMAFVGMSAGSDKAVGMIVGKGHGTYSAGTLALDKSSTG